MLTPRPYQTEAVQAVIKAMDEGTMRQLISLPTGSGKTLVFAMLAKELRRKTLIIAHRDELLMQAASKVKLMWPTARVGMVKGPRQELHADVVICSVQTAVRRLDVLREAGFGLLIIDEAHHAAADSYKTTVRDLGFFDGRPDKLLVGVTATAFRSDSKALNDVFQRVVYERSIMAMMTSGYLCDARGISVTTDIDLSNVRTSGGDFKIDELAMAIDLPERNELVAETYRHHIGSSKGICFCANVDHARNMADAFITAGISATAVWGDMGSDARHRALSAYRDGRYQVLTNCSILTEGFDAPETEAVVLARPTKSKSLFVQMVGRGLRVYPGKRCCSVLDFSDNVGRHKLCNLSTLLGNPNVQIREGETVRQAQDRIDKERQFPGRGHVSIVGHSVEVVDLFEASPYVWLQVGQDFSLSAIGLRFWLRQVGSDQYQVELANSDGVRTLLDNPVPLGYAQGVAEDYLRQDKTAMSIADKGARWRIDKASDAQLRKLQQLKIKYSLDITKGEASILIDKAMLEPPTVKQLQFLRWKGIPVPEGCNKIEARRLIGRYYAQRGRATA